MPSWCRFLASSSDHANIPSARSVVERKTGWDVVFTRATLHQSHNHPSAAVECWLAANVCVCLCICMLSVTWAPIGVNRWHLIQMGQTPTVAVRPRQRHASRMCRTRCDGCCRVVGTLAPVRWQCRDRRYIDNADDLVILTVISLVFCFPFFIAVSLTVALKKWNKIKFQHYVAFWRVIIVSFSILIWNRWLKWMVSHTWSGLEPEKNFFFSNEWQSGWIIAWSKLG